jgi:putative tricarboxylic transport membrane protein
MAIRNLKGWIAEKDANLWTGLFLMILSGALVNEAFELEVGTPRNPGSGFMILGASGLLGLLALRQFIGSLRPHKQESGTVAEKAHWGRILAVIGANLLYIFLLKSVGYLICTFFLLLFLFQVLERGRWIPRVIGSALTSVLTYLFFARLLQLNLPKGLVPFF